MIFLEQTVNQILREEGQVIVTLDDLNITWQDIEDLFVGIYEQSKQYISIYDWVEDSLGLDPSKRDYSHIKHFAYNAYYQKMMPDVNPKQWEFNPYTKNASSMVNSNFSLEVGKYPTLENLEYELPMKLVKEKKSFFTLPCTFNLDDFDFMEAEVFPDHKDKHVLIIQGDNLFGRFNEKTLNGHMISDTDYIGTLKIKSKYVGIKELDLSCELFYMWFKAALMQYIGAMKKQLDLTGVGLPFDINGDQLLERGRQLMDKVEELKGTKQHWSNF